MIVEEDEEDFGEVEGEIGDEFCFEVVDFKSFEAGDVEVVEVKDSDS